VAAATLVRYSLNTVLGQEFPFFTYYLAVTLTIWVAGFGPALVTVALGYLSADLFFWVFHGVQPGPLSIAIDLSATLTVALFGKTMRDANYRMELSMKEARQRQRELEEEIARRLQAEAARQRSEEQFRASFELAAVGKAQVDPANGRFMRVNAKLCHITGYSEEELLAMTVRQITFPGDSEWDTKALRRMIEGAAPEATLEKRYVCKGGRVIWVNVASALIRDQEGRPWRTTTVIQDVTARHLAEEALESAQLKLKDHAGELEKEVNERTASLTATIQSLEQFCYSIAHDLRAPIRAMQGYTTALVEDVPLSAQAADYAHRLSQAALRVDQLVCDLLTYGRMACEPLLRQPISLEGTVNRVLAQLGGQIDGCKARIHIARPLPQVAGDATVVEQILLNLLRNAITFVAPGIQPEVKVCTEEFLSTVRLSVADNGIGIEPQYLDRIFKVFERLHPHEQYPGTGIGLAIVRKGIERLGGRVGVNSRPGEGSCFWFELAK
jgi:PAS domain S-box-containing protein